MRQDRLRWYETRFGDQMSKGDAHDEEQRIDARNAVNGGPSWRQAPTVFTKTLKGNECIALDAVIERPDFLVNTKGMKTLQGISPAGGREDPGVFTTINRERGGNNVRGASCVAYVVIVILAGCAKDETISVALSRESMPVSGLRMLVTDFTDLRPDRRRLGLRHSFFGSEDPFQVKDGTPGQGVAKALTQYLTRSGWPVEYVFSSAGGPVGDVVISGSIVELSLDSTRGVVFTEIAAKSKLAIQAKNASDGTAITYTVSGSGTYNVFWFEEQDAQELMRDVLESSFNKFVGVTTIEPDGLRFRQPGDKERPT